MMDSEYWYVTRRSFSFLKANQCSSENGISMKAVSIGKSIGICSFVALGLALVFVCVPSPSNGESILESFTESKLRENAPCASPILSSTEFMGVTMQPIPRDRKMLPPHNRLSFFNDGTNAQPVRVADDWMQSDPSLPNIKVRWQEKP